MNEKKYESLEYTGVGVVINKIKAVENETLYVAANTHSEEFYATTDYSRIENGDFRYDYLLAKVTKDTDVSVFTQEYLETLLSKAVLKRSLEYWS